MLNGHGQRSSKKHLSISKKVLAREKLLSNQDFNEPFEILTDSKCYQLGLVIDQKRDQLHNLAESKTSQKNYTVADKELMTIVNL